MSKAAAETMKYKEPGARSLTSAVFTILRREIIACRLIPGEKLNIAKLAEAHDVSLASIREALSRLAAGGLVISEDQRGFRVSPASVRDLNDVTETRIEIECLALRRSIARGGADWVDSVRAAWVNLSATTPGTDQWPMLHNEFHAALVGACGLQWLMRFRAVLFEQSERYRSMSRQPAAPHRDIGAEHRDLMQATLDRDEKQAITLLAAHFGRTRDLVLQNASALLQGAEEPGRMNGNSLGDRFSERMERYYKESGR